MKQAEKSSSASPFPQVAAEQKSFFPSQEMAPSVPFFSPATIQPKLEIGSPNDRYEQEADAMAEKVGQQTATSVLTAPAGIQRKCSHCAEEEKLHRKETGSVVPAVGPAFTNELANSTGSGFQLQPGIRSTMETAFGTDFSPVRLHTDSQAVQLSKNIDAQAFTYGNDIYFNAGKYNTDSTDGQRLLAHELTHVVQQGAGVQRKKIQRQPATPPALHEMTDEDWADAARDAREFMDWVLEPYNRGDGIAFLVRLRGLPADQATRLANSDVFFDAIGGTFRGRVLWSIFNTLLFNNRVPEPYLRLNSAIAQGDTRLVTDMLSIVILTERRDRYYQLLRRSLAYQFGTSSLLPEMLRLIDHRTDAGISQRHDASYQEVHYEENAAGNYALRTMTGTISANSYISGSDLRVVVRIQFVDSNNWPFYFLGDNARIYDRWQHAMTNAWNTKFTATNGVTTLNVVFVPVFLSEPDPQAIRIRVMTDDTLRCRPSLEPGRSEQTCWFLDVSDRTVAHEFGHILGASDEYNLPGSYQEVRDAGITLSPEDMMASTVEGIRGTTRPPETEGHDVGSLMGSGSTAVATRHLSRLMRLINSGLPAGTPVFQLRSRS